LEKTSVKFAPFRMAEFSGQWPPGSLTNLHSSNPQPFDWQELNQLPGIDLQQLLNTTPLAYESTQGRPAVRSAICDQYHQSLHMNEVVLTSGAQEGIFLVMQALLKAGDEVIAFTPCFEPLITVAEETGAMLKQLPLIEQTAWSIDWSALQSAMTQNTRLVVVNFPHNPTGCHLNETDWKKLLTLCEQHDCWLFSDEVFRGLEHDPGDRLPAAVDCYAKAISMGVVSKSLALPGVRLGWLSCRDQQVLRRLMAIKSHLSICQSSLDASLCEQLIPHSEVIWQRNVQLIRRNKHKIIDWLANQADFNWQEPVAAATGFVQLKTGSAMDFARQLAEQEKLMVMPGIAFMTDVEGFRLTLGLGDEQFDYRSIRKF